jgi:hypothetical protein
MRQKILWLSPFPPALGGPFAAPLFALLSAMQNSLWMRLQFYFRFFGLNIMGSLNYRMVGLSSEKCKEKGKKSKEKPWFLE